MSERDQMSRRVYIETYGCQMNVADSELMAGILADRGFSAVDSEDEADVILLNTCAIREKAEDRIFGRLGWLKPLKTKRPDLVLGVTGCMAEHLRDQLAKRTPYVDVIAGPDAYRRLPDLIAYAQSSDDAMIDVRLDREELYSGQRSRRTAGVSGFVTIMRGCDKFCTFCIVPYVRGRERSLPADQVVAEVVEMAGQGFKEVVLLGQTVSSYREGGVSFAELLRRVCAVDGIERVRFTSPYPTDFDGELLETLAALPEVGRHLHLPVQSGSTRVLDDMRRQYTAEAFLELALRVRREMPDFAISTDVIVGYPGETEADFEKTLELSRAVQFDTAFMFKYSERSMTAAARRRPDDVPEEVKKQRLSRLIALQNESSQARHAAMIGREVEVLVDGANRRDERQPMGRTSCFKPTMLDVGAVDAADAAARCPAGAMVRARVEASTTHALFARPLSSRAAAA